MQAKTMRGYVGLREVQVWVEKRHVGQGRKWWQVLVEEREMDQWEERGTQDLCSMKNRHLHMWGWEEGRVRMVAQYGT